MAQITVAALGPGDPRLLTLQTAEALRGAKRLVLRTAIHRAVRWLEEEGIAYTSLDDFYERYEDFNAMHSAMAEALWKEAQSHALVYAVADPLQDASVRELARLKAEGDTLLILPGLSRADIDLAQLPEALDEKGYRAVPATSLADIAPDASQPMLVTEINTRSLASDVKLFLMDSYDPEQEIAFYPSSAKMNRRPLRLPLCELDRQARYDHTVAALLPAVPLLRKTRYTVADLQAVMRILRGEDGCPWDREQTHESLRKYLLEEAYEAAGAIDEGDEEHLADELGDVLLQIVFHAAIGQEEGSFDLNDVATNICHKMIRRHPHVFRKGDGEDFNWEALKKAEKGLQTQAEVLSDVARALPALTRAHKVQAKAANVGFDWDNPLDALAKVDEEAEEVRQELRAQRDPAEELGDLLFACVNAARLSGVDAERTLELATEKFIRRFTAMEQLMAADGKHFTGMSLQEMDGYWNRVKQIEKQTRQA